MHMWNKAMINRKFLNFWFGEGFFVVIFYFEAKTTLKIHGACCILSQTNFSRH